MAERVLVKHLTNVRFILFPLHEFISIKVMRTMVDREKAGRYRYKLPQWR